MPFQSPNEQCRSTERSIVWLRVIKFGVMVYLGAGNITNGATAPLTQGWPDKSIWSPACICVPFDVSYLFWNRNSPWSGEWYYEGQHPPGITMLGCFAIVECALHIVTELALNFLLAKQLAFLSLGNSYWSIDCTAEEASIYDYLPGISAVRCKIKRCSVLYFLTND